jgi:hypothetical protein
MSIKDKIKGVFSRKSPGGPSAPNSEDQASRGEEPYWAGKQKSWGPKGNKSEFRASDTGGKYTYRESPPRSKMSPEEEIPLSPEAEANYWGIYQRSRIEYAKTQDPKDLSKYYQRDLSDEEERMLQRIARRRSQEIQSGPEAEVEREAEFARSGVPKTEWKKGWEKKPGEKKSSEVWREVGIPEYQRRRIAAEQPYVESLYELNTQKNRQNIEAEKELYPWEREVVKHGLAEQLESAQAGLSQAQFEREKLQPKAQAIQAWGAEKAMLQMKKEKFAETKRGKVLNIAGKTFDKGMSGLAGGMGNAALGMGMALRSGPSVDTAIYTGRFNPRNVNMQTPASQTHGQTWIQAGRALTPTSKSPAGRALGSTNVPAGMAMMPNLKNLNPAISFRPMGLGLNSSRLSPLPRRRQPPQQSEPGASRVR